MKRPKIPPYTNVLSEIEDGIASGDINAPRAFTEMRNIIQSQYKYHIKAMEAKNKTIDEQDKEIALMKSHIDTLIEVNSLNRQGKLTPFQELTK